MHTLYKNNTWNLVPLPSHGNDIGNKWIFKIKRKGNGTMDKLKARLVAHGYYTPEYSLNYTGSFSLGVKPQIIRIIISLIVSQGWSVRQLDISNAFLNDDLQENIYMVQPQGFMINNIQAMFAS